MIEIIRPSISSAYEALWKRVWNYGQRSNDVLNAFPSDVYGFRNLQALIAHDLGVDRGKYYHYIENAHIIEHSSQDWIEKQNRRVE
jgi:thymidylate synthase